MAASWRISNRASVCSTGTAGTAAPSVRAGIEAMRRRSASIRSRLDSSASVSGSAVTCGDLLRHGPDPPTLIEHIFDIEVGQGARLHPARPGQSPPEAIPYEVQSGEYRRGTSARDAQWPAYRLGEFQGSSQHW